jgi:hypothetical protein
MVWNALAQWTLRTPTRSRTHEPRKGSRRLRTHVDVECLEDRLTPSGISGHVFQDVTGNGLSADDTALKGVRVELFRDVNHDGKLDRGDGAPVAVAFSKQDGSYSFSGLAADTYFVKEVLPFHNVRTAPVLTSYYTVNLGSTDVTGQDFASYHKPEGDVLKNVYFLINGTTKVTDLRGHVHQGDTVQAFFTVKKGETAQVTLVSYTAPAATFDANTASQQQEFDVQTGTFGPGDHSLTVKIPNSFFQVDFVLGAAIDHFGPAGSNIFYHSQCRFKSGDNGGTGSTPPPAPSSLSGIAYLDNNMNGVFDFGDQGLVGITETLTGTDVNGNAVSMTTQTGNDGSYHFTGLLAGTYTITESRPSNFVDETPNLGTGATNDGSLVPPTPPSVTSNAIGGIVLGAGQDATGFSFGEQNIPNG